MPSTSSTLTRWEPSRPQEQYLDKASRFYDSLAVDPPDAEGCITVVAYIDGEPVGEFYVDAWGNVSTIWV